ncbi:hypothetical protein PMJ87_00360 [Pseudomonas aeruginosa]|nr:hypothetical protein [Pseudomonas aeruginosa]WCI69814.1 hypothetical protein PMJ87_00360 [Pseudomonas aeruginosa]
MVYLAQAEGRLAPNGALIQGRDVKLVRRRPAYLRARNDLGDGRQPDNSGLIEAGKRLICSPATRSANPRAGSSPA